MTEKVEIAIDFNQLFQKVSNQTIDSLALPEIVKEFDTPVKAANHFSKLLEAMIDEYTHDLKINLQAHLAQKIVEELAE